MLSIYILDVLYLFNNHLDRRSSRVRLFRSRRGALGPFRVRPFRQSPLERERLVALDSSAATAELWTFSRAPLPTEPSGERAFSLPGPPRSSGTFFRARPFRQSPLERESVYSRVRLFRSRRGGPFRARPFRQSPLERERLVALDSSGAIFRLCGLPMIRALVCSGLLVVLGHDYLRVHGAVRDLPQEGREVHAKA